MTAAFQSIHSFSSLPQQTKGSLVGSEWLIFFTEDVSANPGSNFILPGGSGTESYPMVDPTSLSFYEIVDRCSASPMIYQDLLGHGLGPLTDRRSWPEAMHCTHMRAPAGHSITIREQDKGIPHASVMSWTQLPRNWSEFLYHGTTHANADKIRKLGLLLGCTNHNNRSNRTET